MAYGGILRPPHAAASSFLEWGVDLWPYINGKSIALGVKPLELDSVDLIDYLHYLFEEDMRATSAEEIEARGQVRSTLYSQLYGTTYKYATGKKQVQQLDIDAPLDDDEIPVPIDPFERSQVTKSFIAPSIPNEDAVLPFGKALDAPLR